MYEELGGCNTNEHRAPLNPFGVFRVPHAWTLRTRMALNDGFVARAYARTGLLGNPSDQYEGKVIGVSVRNYYAEVSSQRLE